MRARVNLVVDSTLHAAKKHLEIFHNCVAGSIEQSAWLFGGWRRSVAPVVARIDIQLQFVSRTLAFLLLIAEVEAAAHTV